VSTPAPPAARHRDFYRHLDAILRQIDRERGLESMLKHILDESTKVFATSLGIESGRLYREDGDAFVIVHSIGSKGPDILGRRVPRNYAIFEDLNRHEVSYFDPGDPRLDPELEQGLGVGHFASFFVDPEHQYVVSFGYGPGFDRQELELALNTLRYAIDHRLRELGYENQLKQTRTIQVSLLPAHPPEFEGYELAGHSIPAEEVGGDVFDFLPIDANLLGVMIGDASGHGLPAALQARDVVIGLRMGVQRDLKITSVARKLNRVIHQSGLTSRFVSVFYGEVERNGNFVFINAGHEPGLVLRSDGSRLELRSTGIVMGPVGDADFRREMVTLGTGDLLLLYTDGVVERTGPGGEYGLPRLEAHARELMQSGTPFSEFPQALLDRPYRFGRDLPWVDDATVVVLRRGSPATVVERDATVA
jgi:serine phosphatase RsbU (regulator of sigma subunit)